MPGAAVEGRLVVLVDPVAAGLPQQIGEGALRRIALVRHDEAVMAVAGELLADLDEILPGDGRLEPMLGIDVGAVVLGARIHVARDGRELAGLGD